MVEKKHSKRLEKQISKSNVPYCDVYTSIYILSEKISENVRDFKPPCTKFNKTEQTLIHFNFEDN